ncbi:MAG TPA: hypothetical protein VGL34_20330 [Steroidobacteraceae bacterium]|jgi:hypothetical protein
MNMPILTRISAAVCLSSLLLWGCHKAPPTAAEAAPASDGKTGESAKPAGGQEKGNGKEEASEGVVLTPDQVEKLGLATQTAQSSQYTEEASGYGVVVPHDAIAQAAAELVTAQATQRQSQSALSRAKRLSGTPGAVSADVEEAAVHQAAVDTAALTLTTQRLSTTLGMKPPWKIGENSPILQDLASGRIKLVRVTFPLGALSGGTPASLRATHIGGAGKPAEAEKADKADDKTDKTDKTDKADDKAAKAAKADDKGWKMNTVWDAPADATVPGRSYFALLKGSDAGEGERLLVWAPIGETASGVVIPAAAAVMSEGKYWCYLEKKPGTYVRTEVDTGIPTADGYFVTEGVAAGDKVVVTAAGQLLAKESNSGAESD